jgi:uncharacterized protein
MTDAADDPAASEPPTASSSEPSAPPTVVSRLVVLQRIDTTADQLANRRERLPERDELISATEQSNTWDRARNSMRTRLDELTAVIESTEAEAAVLATHKRRLEGQLKTVIAPREAEALMHEIATLDEQTDVLDTTELEALEEQAELDDRLASHLGNEAAVSESTSAAKSTLDAVVADIDAELASLESQRTQARAELSDDVLRKYDRIRVASGVAVATLSGHRCEGCHLDLSAAEIDVVKDEAAASGGIADCPQCGRMLAI